MPTDVLGIRHNQVHLAQTTDAAPIDGGTLPPMPGAIQLGKAPVRDVVALLESLLEAARAGRLRAVAIGGVGENDASLTECCGEASVTSLLGVLRLLEHRMLVINEGGRR